VRSKKHEFRQEEFFDRINPVIRGIKGINRIYGRGSLKNHFTNNETQENKPKMKSKILKKRIFRDPVDIKNENLYPVHLVNPV